MALRLNAVQVRATWDQTLGDAYNIEGFTPNIGNPKTVTAPRAGNVYIWVNGLPDYSEGEPVPDTALGSNYLGFEFVRYTTPQMHIDTYQWLINNYRGQVTANIRKRLTTYDRCNCELDFEILSMPRFNFPEVQWIFKIVETL